MYCVYIHKNKINGKQYCGMTNDVKTRWASGGIAYKPYKGRLSSKHFWNAIQKYGFDNFEHIIIKDGLTYEEACELEKKTIAKLDLRNESKGYNIAVGGRAGHLYKEHPKGMLGRKHTEEWKKNHSEWASNPENNCMTNGDVVWGKTHEHPRGMLGKHHTAEHKAHISEIMKGRQVSDDTRAKMSAANKGRTVSEESRKRISESKKGQCTGKDNAFSSPVSVTYPDGRIEKYDCVREMLKSLKISTCLFYTAMKNNGFYEAKGRSKNVHADIDGCVFKYVKD